LHARPREKRLDWLESIDWSDKFPSDLVLYISSVLGFVLLPAHLGRRVWALLAWFLFVNVAFLIGLPYTPNWQRPYLFVLIGQVPWILFLADLFFRGRISRVLAEIPLRELVLWQAVRLMGIHFVLGAIGRHVPQEFALQIGFSEIITGLGALGLYALYRPQSGWYRTLLIFWNTYGLTSVLAAEYRTILSNPHLPVARYSQEIFQYMAAYPQNWLYCFWYPIAIGMHASVFYKLYLGRASGSDEIRVEMSPENNQTGEENG
jgi:hypothetical protein